MRKLELVNRFRARHTANGYSLEYIDTKHWIFYTPYASYYDELSNSGELSVKELRGYIRLIKSQKRYKVN